MLITSCHSAVIINEDVFLQKAWEKNFKRHARWLSRLPKTLNKYCRCVKNKRSSNYLLFFHFHTDVCFNSYNTIFIFNYNVNYLFLHCLFPSVLFLSFYLGIAYFFLYYLNAFCDLMVAQIYNICFYRNTH